MTSKPIWKPEENISSKKINKKESMGKQNADKLLIELLANNWLKPLINKSNMTPKDIINMKKAIKYLKENWLLNDEMKLILSKVRYSPESINIGANFARKDMYDWWVCKFKWKSYYTVSTLDSANKILKKDWLRVPNIRDIKDVLAFIEWIKDAESIDVFSDENAFWKNPKLQLIWILLWLDNPWIAEKIDDTERELINSEQSKWGTFAFQHYLAWWNLCYYWYSDEGTWINIELDKCFWYPVRPIVTKSRK